jgi:hypothetical protein
MKRLIPLFFIFMGMALMQTACKMAPPQNDGDTVSAKVFEPADTSKKARQARAKADSMVTDSIGLYYIGEGSTAQQVQLVSYPSRRDTAVYSKGRHIKVAGNADFGHVVRAKFWVSDKGDTLVTRLEEWK